MKLPTTKRQWKAFRGRLLKADERTAEIYAEHAGRMAHGYFYNAGLSAADAEDLAVSAVTDTLLKIELFDGENFPAWFFTILKNMLADKFRRRVVLSPMPEGDFAEPGWRHGLNGSLPEKIHEALDKALGALKPLDREIVQWCEGHDRIPQLQLAKALGLSASALRVRLHRAKAELRKILEADENVIAFSRTKQTKHTKL